MTQRLIAPDYADRLPEPIRHFTTKTFLDLPEYAHLAHGKGADPDGTHTHLVTDPGSLGGTEDRIRISSTSSCRP